VEENDDGHKKHGHPYPLTTGVPRAEQLKIQVYTFILGTLPELL